MTYFLARLYNLLLGLYPVTFRTEFREQMLLDFSEMIADARQKSKLSLFRFCLRELIDFSVSLVQVHMKEYGMSNMFRSQPVNSGLRSAVGFGIVFATTNLVGLCIAINLASTDHSLIDRLRVFYVGLFQTERGFELISWLPMGLNSLLMGLFLGILFAFFFADRSKYPRFILAGVLGWFLHDMVQSFLGWCFNLYVFLDGDQMSYFNLLTWVLSGAFLGLIFFVAGSEQRAALHLLVICVFAYPSIAYLSMVLLTDIFVFNSPWRFIALVVLFAIFILTIFIATIKIDAGQNRFWLVAAGAIGYPILVILIGSIARQILPPYPTTGLFMDDPAFWQWQLVDVYTGAIRGVLFGLVVGILFGMHNRNRSFQTARSC